MNFYFISARYAEIEQKQRASDDEILLKRVENSKHRRMSYVDDDGNLDYIKSRALSSERSNLLTLAMDWDSIEVARELLLKDCLENILVISAVLCVLICIV